ncbi:MAG TPA: TIGR01777 family oxidoreductase [Candidatus Binatia bacterium]|jgi:uncharacterized protein (TIGR01777 family)|nr:TIGR01777 family oxidoreductase [Candidatus Binatia bacterium]
MRVLVTGATGLVGKRLCDALRAASHAVTVVSREPGRVPGRAVGWDAIAPAVADSDAIVNLAGESIASSRWTAARKVAIRASRIEATRSLVRAIELASERPKVLINASAVGWYGPHGDEPLEETSRGPGDDFLARVCRDWEAEAVRAEALGLRVARLRFGVVLAPDGGALAKMLIPFRACLGGPIGGGRQWMSWVHRDDVVGLVREALGNEAYAGAVNVTSPNPVTNRDFVQALGHALGRPAVLPVPGLALRLVLGEMADMLLTGQRVLPAVAERNGYAWRQPELGAALASCIG